MTIAVKMEHEEQMQALLKDCRGMEESLKQYDVVRQVSVGRCIHESIRKGERKGDLYDAIILASITTLIECEGRKATDEQRRKNLAVAVAWISIGCPLPEACEKQETVH